MDALFVVVAELFLIPLILWGLITLELTLGVAASVVSVLLGRRSVQHAVSSTLRVIRKRLLWSMLALSGGLLLADLLLFDALVALALGHVDDREDLELSYTQAEGSFILGRIELRHVELGGTRGGVEDPSARFDVAIDSFVVDIDTLMLLRASLGVEELALDGVRGSFERLHAVERAGGRGPGLDLTRDFAVERLHIGDLDMRLRDQTKAPLPATGAEPTGPPEGPRELAIELVELDLGPLRSDTALFDLLYRVRGRGRVAGLAFELTNDVHEGQPRTTLEVPELPLALIGERIEDSTGIRVGGSASLELVNRYRDDPPEPRVELELDLALRELSLEAGAEAGPGAKLMLAVAARGLAQLGADFPLHIALTVLRSELEGVRNLADSGLVELLSDTVAGSLREQLTRAGEGAGGKGAAKPGLLQRRPGRDEAQPDVDAGDAAGAR